MATPGPAPAAPPTPQVIRQTKNTLLAHCGPGKSICPSEVARQLDPTHWRTHMPAIHTTATAGHHAGHWILTQHHTPVATLPPHGPYRIQTTP